MSGRIFFEFLAALAAVLLLSQQSAIAGERVRAPAPVAPPAQRVPAPIGQAPMELPRLTITVSVRPKGFHPVEPVYVTIRSPGGVARRFALEGGQAAIRTQQVIVKAGQSLTIRWAPTR